MKHKSLLVALFAGLVCLPLVSCGEDLDALRQKAEMGDAKAQRALGVAYDRGEGVPRDFKEAVKWFRLAAEQGDAKAQCVLGTAYGLGDGVPLDYPQAYAWFNLSMAQGYEKAEKGQKLVLGKMTPEQIDEGKRLAEEYAKKYVKQAQPSNP